jgi:hypothetical protein
MQTSYLLTMQLKEEQVSEVGIILLRPLKMKERPFRRRETLTVSHRVTFHKIPALINTAMEKFFSQNKTSFPRAQSSNTPAHS